MCRDSPGWSAAWLSDGHVISGAGMTDLGGASNTVPARLGVSGRFEDGQLILDVTPIDPVLTRGVVRVSVLAYAADAVAGICLDDDPTHWTLTTDLSVRMLPVAAPMRISATNTIVRRGGRSATCRVTMTDDHGSSIASAAVGFARVPRRDTDPPKPAITPEQVPALFGRATPLDRPLREAAAVEVVDAGAGVVEVLVTPELRNPAGTIQGAMVALVVEAAAEELVAARFGRPAIVTDLEVRYLAQAQHGPVRSRCELLGDQPDSPVLVELFDTSADRLTTLAYARATPV
jgi:acyl-coenzyme A thioesterase PaaI-like protein